MSLADSLDILYEDNHCLALNKPAGWPTTHFEGREETFDRVAKSYLKEKYGKPGKVFLGAVPVAPSPVVRYFETASDDSGSPGEVAASLSDLNRINRWFGGISTTTSMIRRVAQKLGVLSLSMLEVAAGSGYVPERARQKLVHDGIELKVTLLDRAPSHLVNGNRAIAGDVLALPFRDASFDLVGSVIFLHHLSPEQVIQSVNEALRVSRTAVLINDVVRHPMHLALVYAGLPLFRSRLTHHDAPASVRQAYTTAEIRDLLKRTSAARVEIHRHYLFRMGVMVWK